MTARAQHGPSLEEWEEKTRLSGLEQKSVFEINDSCAELPLPPELLRAISNSPISQIHSPAIDFPEIQIQSPPRSPPATSPRFPALPSARLAVQSSSLQRSLSTTQLLAESTAADDTNAQKGAEAMGFDKPINNIQQFFDWFAKTELEMEQDQEDIYRNYLATVLSYRQSCDDFLGCIDDTIQLFASLENDYKFDRLSKLADQLAEGLAFFNHLEPISKKFNSANEDICTSPSFHAMLRQLDESIAYVEAHVQYRDSELYLMRFRQCMTRGMTYIKMYIIKTLREIGYEIYKSSPSKGQKMSAAAQTTMLYAKFRALGQKLRPLSFELEKRCEGHKEYFSLLTDAIGSYIQVRQQLLSPIITAKIQELGPYNENILEFARNGCGYILNICLEEFQLFYCFFDSGEEELYSYLEHLTSYLYDYLRPRIIHENRIEILSELCNIFQLHIIRDLEGADVNKGHTLAFSYLVRNILQDTQSRLVFRAESYIHNDIEKYNPTTADLDYPNVLQIERKSSIILSPPAADTKQAAAWHNDPATLDVAEDSDGSLHEATDDTVVSSSPPSALASPPSNFTDNNASWFPPLQRTLWILSKLYRCVRTSVFEDLAQEAVSICKGALISAGESISNNQSKMDGQLFLIKHLLILKEQLAPFEANLIHAGKELDFSHVNVALSAFTKGRTSIFNPNALFDFAQSGIPRVVEISIDSRREIDRELKRKCEDFILDSSQSATEPISNFITQVSAFQVANNMRTERLALSDQSFATPSSAYGAFEAFREAVNARLSFTMHRLGQYLDDAKMEAILLRPIQMNISSRYRQFYEIVSNQYDLETLPKQIPSTESMALWISQLVEQGKVLDDDLFKRLFMIYIKSLLLLLLPLLVHAQSEDTNINIHDPIFWVKIVVIIILVILSGIVAGLTLGLMSLDETNLSILSNSGTPTQKKQAARIAPIRKNGHLLLTTLLLTNTVINETLPVLFDGIFGGGIIAVVASTVLLVIFSEIIPQAVCSRHGLAIGAFFAWPVRILICILFVVAWPIAKILDKLLGSQHGVLYRSAELKELIAMHATTQEKGGDLQTDAVTILQGALDLQEKSVRHAMTPINHTFMLSINTILDRKTMSKILRSGHSRIPIFDGPDDQALSDRNISGVLLVKSLILLDPDDNTPLKDVKLGTMPQVDPKMSLFELLNVFQEGGSHMATVYGLDDDDESTISDDGTDSSIVPSSKKKGRFIRASGSSTSSSSSSESHNFFSRLRRGRKSDIEKGLDTDDQTNKGDHIIDVKAETAEQDEAGNANDIDGKTHSTAATPSVKVPAVNRVIGIITLEDVLEELIQEEIYDETDVRKLASLTAMRADTANGERVIVASHKIAPNVLAQLPAGGKRGVWKKRRRLSFESNRSLDDREQRREALRKQKEMEENEENADSVGDLPPNSPGGGSDTTGSRHRIVARSMTDPTGFEMLTNDSDKQK